MTIKALDAGTGTDPTDWGMGTDGNSWDHSAGSSTLSRGGGKLSALGGSQTNLMLYGPSITDQDAQINVTEADSGNIVSVVVRCTGTTFYYADVGAFTNFFVVGKCISGSFSDLQFFSISQSISTEYSIKLQAVGSTINAAIWLAGGSQPAYQISFTDTSIAGPGQSGVFFFGGGSSAATFDNFVMTDTVSTINLATEARANFLVRSELQTQGHATFKIRANLQDLCRATFRVRAALQIQARSAFKVRAVLVSVARSTFKIRAVLQTHARSAFKIRAVLQALGRATFKIKSVITALLTLGRARFLIKKAPVPVIPITVVTRDNKITTTTRDNEIEVITR